MACKPASQRGSEGSHFSGRPPPPYHLFDLLKEFQTNFVVDETEQQDEVESCRDPSTGRANSTYSSRASEHGVTSVQALSAANELAPGDKQPSGISIDRKTVLSTATVSTSEDGGCRLPLSSTMGSQEQDSVCSIAFNGVEFLEGIRRMRKAFWKAHSQLPEIDIAQLWQQKWADLTPFARESAQVDFILDNLGQDTFPLPKEPAPLPRPRLPLQQKSPNQHALRAASAIISNTGSRLYFAERALSHIDHRQYLDHRRQYERHRNLPKPRPSPAAVTYTLRNPSVIRSEHPESSSDSDLMDDSSFETWAVLENSIKRTNKKAPDKAKPLLNLKQEVLATKYPPSAWTNRPKMFPCKFDDCVSSFVHSDALLRHLDLVHDVQDMGDWD